MEPGWHLKTFAELDNDTLYSVLQLRQAVFVVEQDCAYLDLDGLDRVATHLFRADGTQILACARCLPPGSAYSQSSIGRIIVAPAARGTGLGRELVRRGIDFNRRQWPGVDIRIGAQAHLEDFYASLGFVSERDYYPEDGIEHVHMLLAAGADTRASG